MTNYSLIFVVALLVNIVVTFASSDYFKKGNKANGSSGGETDGGIAAAGESKAKWTILIRKYLLVYLLALLSDWLQGPFVYALYENYGYSQQQIAVLFVAGFGSSMVFGSFVGGMADWGGRRAFVVLFCVIYSLSCITKHFKNFGILMIGRLLGGVATSLLFSVFEAWLIRAHADANIKHMLGKSFSWSSYGNSVIAIVAGLLGEKASKQFPMIAIQKDTFYAGGYLNPFDISLAALILSGVFALLLWDENYGESQERSPSGEAAHKSGKWYDGLKNAYVTTTRSTDIFLCGVISSLFEGSMYIFVFMWTPALQAGANEDPPFGLVFSTFMVCCMAGSSLFSIQSEKHKTEEIAVAVMGFSAVSMAMIALSPSRTIKFIGMNFFEMAVGMYFPTMGTLKGCIVPEDKRAAIYNLFRIPLNFIVLFSLLTALTPTQSFLLNASMLGVGTFLMFKLMQRRAKMGVSRDAENELLLEEVVSPKEESV